MDRDNWGGKTGGGGAQSSTWDNVSRRERLRQLAIDSIDITKDPYYFRNHVGQIECKMCMTVHTNEGNYLAHTQGKRHQSNLTARALREAKMNENQPAPLKAKAAAMGKPRTVKIGRPGYQVTKMKDPESGQKSLLFEIQYPEIAEDIQPRHRIMSAFEQKVEIPDKNYQYLLFAAEPYETIAFKIPNREVDKSEGKFHTKWNSETLSFSLHIAFKEKPRVPAAPPPPSME